MLLCPGLSCIRSIGWEALDCVPLRAGTPLPREDVALHFCATHRVGSVAPPLLCRLRELAPPPCARASLHSADPSPLKVDPPLSSVRAAVARSRAHGALPPRVAVASPFRTYSSIRDVATYHCDAKVQQDLH